MSRPTAAPSECPVCGADLPPRARACPECGADERAGWDEEATRYEGVELPDSAFDDPESATGHRATPSLARRLLWPLVGALLIALFVYGLFAGH